MIEKIQQHRQDFDAQVSGCSSQDQLKQIRIDFLGKKGCVAQIMKDLRSVPAEEKPLLGKHINQFKGHIDQVLEEKSCELAKKDQGTPDALKGFDPSFPGKKEIPGSIHPISQVLEEITTIFFSLGFQVEEGPEIETDYYNFEALNIPRDHPARDMQDTFYIEDDVVLRTHTSPVQIHVMENQQPPLRIIAPGKVYRCDSDITHTPMFHQVEGLMVDEHVSFTDLKAILIDFLHRFFERDDLQVRFRP